MHEEHNIMNSKQLEEQNEALMDELFKLKSKPQGRIGYLFIFIGIILFSFSIDYSVSIIAFLSIALLFWGGLFLYIRPTNFVRQNILFSNLENTYSIYNHILDNTNYEGKPHFFSPKTLAGFKDVFLYIPKSKEDIITIEDLNSARTRSNYIRIPPLGLGLAKLMEEESKINFATIDIERLSKILEKVLINDLELVKEFELYTNNESNITIKIVDPLIKVTTDNNHKYFCLNYMINAITCAIAKTINRPVIIEKLYNEEKEITRADLKIV